MHVVNKCIIVYDDSTLNVLAWIRHLQGDSDTKECAKTWKYIVVKHVPHTSIKPSSKRTAV